jgi:hypothetical protein
MILWRKRAGLLEVIADRAAASFNEGGVVAKIHGRAVDDGLWIVVALS